MATSNRIGFMSINGGVISFPGATTNRELRGCLRHRRHPGGVPCVIAGNHASGGTDVGAFGVSLATLSGCSGAPTFNADARSLITP